MEYLILDWIAGGILTMVMWYVRRWGPEQHRQCPKELRGNGHMFLVRDGIAACKFCDLPQPRGGPDARGRDS